MSRNDRLGVRLPANKCQKDGCKNKTRDSSAYCHLHRNEQYTAKHSLENVPAPTLGSVAKDAKEFHDSTKEFIDVIPAVAALSTQGPVGVAAAGIIAASTMASATERGLGLAQGVFDGSDPSNKVEKVLHTDLGTGFWQRIRNALTLSSPYPASPEERDIITQHRDALKDTLERKNASGLYRDMNKILTRMAKPSKLDPLKRIDDRIRQAEGIIDDPNSTAEHRRQQRVERSILLRLDQELRRSRASGS